ncbi:MAG: N-acetylmuramoyl-L-alanine amidase [Alphaproteobacteria bacterium]|nr:N-acetylmuramoyl-L-alanine amidase [Alphaproteobacteria bacterium]
MFFRKALKSPNFNERPAGRKPDMIVLHYTGMKTGKAALKRLCSPDSEVSAHYFLNERGRVRHLVEDEQRAWHAGVSYWAGERDINGASIGIEIVNPGHEFGYQAFSERQIGALAFLCCRLMEKHRIAPERVVAHSDVAPSRKIDPGHLLPWERLARKNIGLWPEVEEGDLAGAPALLENRATFQALLCGYGYNPEVPFEDVVVAYHRHFCPEKFKSWDDRPEQPDILSCARLLALSRMKAQKTEKPPGFPDGSS